MVFGLKCEYQSHHSLKKTKQPTLNQRAQNLQLNKNTQPVKSKREGEYYEHSSPNLNPAL